MRKGELSRTRIVDTAERLFWSRGYEETSVQDILDELSMSKGGFYHHFASKEELLGEVAEKRLRARIEDEVPQLPGRDVKDALNRILLLTDPFEREETAYAAMLTRACVFAGDVSLRERQRRVVTDMLTEPLEQVVLRGIREDLFCVRRVKETSRLVLLLAQDAVEDAMRMLAGAKGEREGVLDACHMMQESRRAVERLLTAPFGTCRITEMDRLNAVVAQLEKGA